LLAQKFEKIQNSANLKILTFAAPQNNFVNFEQKAVLQEAKTQNAAIL
jgi:hypothetical protein